MSNNNQNSRKQELFDSFTELNKNDLFLDDSSFSAVQMVDHDKDDFLSKVIDEDSLSQDLQSCTLDDTNQANMEHTNIDPNLIQINNIIDENNTSHVENVKSRERYVPKDLKVRKGRKRGPKPKGEKEEAEKYFPFNPTKNVKQFILISPMTNERIQEIIKFNNENEQEGENYVMLQEINEFINIAYFQKDVEQKIMKMAEIFKNSDQEEGDSVKIPLCVKGHENSSSTGFHILASTFNGYDVYQNTPDLIMLEGFDVLKDGFLRNLVPKTTVEKPKKEPRPANGFIIFRSSLQRFYALMRIAYFLNDDDLKKPIDFFVNNNFKQYVVNKLKSEVSGRFSTFAGLVWKTESKQFKKEFSKFKEIEKAVHKASFPGYVYKPRKGEQR